jgi:predicted nucleotidyltransferase
MLYVSMNIKLSQKTTDRLKELGVGLIYFFGSRAQEHFLPLSDYDIGIVFMDPKTALADHPLGFYTNIYTAITTDIPEKINGPRVDISFLQKANPALRMTAVKNGIVLFEINSAFRADFEGQAIKDYDDYLPIKKEYEEATMRAFQ